MVVMHATVLDVLTAVLGRRLGRRLGPPPGTPLSLVSAIGVLVVSSKVDRLTGRVDALEGTLHLVVTGILARKPSGESS